MNPTPHFISSLAEAYSGDFNKEQFTALLKTLDAAEELKSEQNFSGFMEKVRQSASFGLSLELEGKVIASEQFVKRCFDCRVSLDTPGNYELKLSTGRVIWQDRLETEDLFLMDLSGERTLPVAAETELTPFTYSRYVGLLGNQFMLQLIPGISCAQLKIIASRWFG